MIRDYVGSHINSGAFNSVYAHKHDPMLVIMTGKADTLKIQALTLFGLIVEHEITIERNRYNAIINSNMSLILKRLQPSKDWSKHTHDEFNYLFAHIDFLRKELKTKGLFTTESFMLKLAISEYINAECPKLALLCSIMLNEQNTEDLLFDDKKSNWLFDPESNQFIPSDILISKSYLADNAYDDICPLSGDETTQDSLIKRSVFS
jgi:hypothetical protein